MQSVNEFSLDYYFVAFIDLLGFSYMVKSDCEAPRGTEIFINKLIDAHKHTLELNSKSSKLNLLEFSDSVIFAIPFNKEDFNEFINIISIYQYKLFCEDILCRGGVAYGKHFYKEGFLFSNGLIEAFNIERSIARYPRIVISKDLIELINIDKILTTQSPLIKENDGAIFIDFYKNGQREDILIHLENILTINNNIDPSVKEKHRWLREYFKYKFGPLSQYDQPRFLEMP